jgi:hypothetical protein
MTMPVDRRKNWIVALGVAAVVVFAAWWQFPSPSASADPGRTSSVEHALAEVVGAWGDGTRIAIQGDVPGPGRTATVRREGTSVVLTLTDTLQGDGEVTWHDFCVSGGSIVTLSLSRRTGRSADPPAVAFPEIWIASGTAPRAALLLCRG